MKFVKSFLKTVSPICFFEKYSLNVYLLQYMKCTTLDNHNVMVKDERILHLDRIVNEVKQSEEWEAVEMNIFEIGVEQGIEQGIVRGNLQTLVRSVELSVKNFHVSLQEACEGLEISVEEYERAKRQIPQWEEGERIQKGDE